VKHGRFWEEVWEGDCPPCQVLTMQVGEKQAKDLLEKGQEGSKDSWRCRVRSNKLACRGQHRDARGSFWVREGKGSRGLSK